MKSKNTMSHSRLWIFVSIALLGTPLVLSACSANSVDILARSFGFYEPRQQEQTRDLANQIIVPGYQRFLASAKALDSAVNDLKNKPTQAQ
jgi:predicted lipoprotein